MPQISTYKKEDESNDPALPGRYTIHDAYITKKDGTEYDLTTKLVRFNIYESIHTPWLSADFTVLDTANLPRLAKLGGGEKIIVKVSDARGNNRTYTFHLNAISDRKAASSSSWSYKLHGVSKNYFKAHLNLVSKSFVNKKPEQIISTLLKEDMGFDVSKFNWAVSSANTPCVIPSWDAARAISWVASNAESTEYVNSPWRLFMDIESNIYFVPVELLYKSPRARTGTLYYQTNRIVHSLINSRMKDHELMFERLEIVDSLDVLENLKSGLFVSEVAGIDLANRVETTEKFEYSDFKAEEHLGNTPAKIDGFDVETPHFWSTPVHLGLFSQESTEDTSTKRAAVYSSKNQQTKLIVLRGVLYASHKFRVGQKYKVDVPDFSGEKLDAADARLSGDFLIEKIKHSYGGNDEYKVLVQLYRDAFTGT